MKWRQKNIFSENTGQNVFLKTKKNEWKKIEMKKTIFSRAKEQNVFCCEQEKLLEKKIWNEDKKKNEWKKIEMKKTYFLAERTLETGVQNMTKIQLLYFGGIFRKSWFWKWFFLEKNFRSRFSQKNFFFAEKKLWSLVHKRMGSSCVWNCSTKSTFKKKKKKKKIWFWIYFAGHSRSFAIRPSTLFAFSYSVTSTFCHEDAFLQLDSYKKCRNDWMQKNTENQIHKKQNISDKSSRKIVPLFVMSSRAEEQNVLCFGEGTVKKSHWEKTLKWRQKNIFSKNAAQNVFWKTKKMNEKNWDEKNKF